jgi:hypothetical protein
MVPHTKRLKYHNGLAMPRTNCCLRARRVVSYHKMICVTQTSKTTDAKESKRNNNHKLSSETLLRQQKHKVFKKRAALLPVMGGITDGGGEKRSFVVAPWCRGRRALDMLYLPVGARTVATL